MRLAGPVQLHDLLEENVVIVFAVPERIGVILSHPFFPDLIHFSSVAHFFFLFLLF